MTIGRTYVRVKRNDGRMGDAGSAHGRLRRAIASENVLLAEMAARELGWVALEDALALLLLYAEHDPAKLEAAGRRWLRRALAERTLAVAEAQLLTAAVGALATEMRDVAAATLREAERSSRLRGAR